MYFVRSSIVCVQIFTTKYTATMTLIRLSDRIVVQKVVYTLIFKHKQMLFFIGKIHLLYYGFKLYKFIFYLTNMNLH